MAILKNTSISGQDGLTIPKGTTGDRPIDKELYKVVEKFTTIGASTWTCPTGITEIELLIVGGGGSGGRAHTTNGCGGGGAGGVVYKNVQAVTPGTNYTVTVGAGGAGSSAGANANGNNGANSSFVGTGINLIALGGGRGGQGQSAFPGTSDGSNSQDASPGGSGGGAGTYDTPAGLTRPYTGKAATQPGSASGGLDTKAATLEQEMHFTPAAVAAVAQAVPDQMV